MCRLCFTIQDLFVKVSSGNFTAMPEINSKITIKTPEQRQWPRSGTFIINFEQI